LSFLCEPFHDYYIYYVFAQTEFIVSCYFANNAISFVAFVCTLHSRVVCRNVCLVSDNVLSYECAVLDKATLCIQQKSDESLLCVQQNDVEKEISGLVMRCLLLVILTVVKVILCTLVKILVNNGQQRAATSLSASS